MKDPIVTVFLMLFLSQCTYDSTPPNADKINDAKQLLTIDVTGLTPQRAVRIQYTDSLGTTTLQTSAEKTDASGRLLYPLYMTRGTRSYSVKIDVDGGTGNLGSGVTFTQNASFSSDGETKELKITSASFTAY